MSSARSSGEQSTPAGQPPTTCSKQDEHTSGDQGSVADIKDDIDEISRSEGQTEASSSRVLVKPEVVTTATPSSSTFVVKAEAVLAGFTDSDDEDEGRMQIRLSVSEDSDNSFGSDEDFEVFPTTILSVEDTAGDTAAAEAPVDAEPFIPTTFDADDKEDETQYTELSGDAYNSFWKYKKLPKGPKVRETYSLALPSLSDPHKPIIFNDPVFDKSHTNTVLHYGKPRVGEGNDITPNPHKLVQLGKDIQKINDKMTSLSNTSSSKKEKMKLSSRICRMKRSANHEANKIKFAGLEQEREELSRVIRELKRAQAMSQAPSTSTTSTITKEMYQTKVAGRTSEYVNSVLEGEKLPGPHSYLDTDSESD